MRYAILLLTCLALRAEDFVPFLTQPVGTALTITRFGSNSNYAAHTSIDITGFQVNGAQKLLVVVVYYEAVSGETISSVVWDTAGVAEALTLADTYTDTGVTTEVYRRIAPSDATSNVRVSFTGTGVTESVVTCQLVNGANQVTPFGAFSHNSNGAVNDIDVDVAATAGCLLMASLTNSDPDATVVSPFVEFQNVSAGVTFFGLIETSAPYQGAATSNARFTQVGNGFMSITGWAILAP